MDTTDRLHGHFAPRIPRQLVVGEAQVCVLDLRRRAARPPAAFTVFVTGYSLPRTFKHFQRPPKMPVLFRRLPTISHVDLQPHPSTISKRFRGPHSTFRDSQTRQKTSKAVRSFSRFSNFFYRDRSPNAFSGLLLLPRTSKHFQSHPNVSVLFWGL